MMHRYIVLAQRVTLAEAKKMVEKVDGNEREGGTVDGERRQCNSGFEKRTLTRRRFVKTSAAVGAAVGGIPLYNLTDIADIILKEEGELILYPHLHRFMNKIFQVLNIKLMGCNWNCQWCTNKFPPFEDGTPLMISIGEIIDLSSSVCLDGNIPVLFAISGGEPLLQKAEVLMLIKSLKRKNNYTVELDTNGSLINEDFIDKANDLDLDRINISFRSLDDNWHKWYTGGQSIQNTIDALRLVTEKFNGLAVVSITLFPVMDVIKFEDMCKFLHKINPDFLIRISCPYNDKHECDDCYLKKINKTGGIALQYFHRVMPDPNYLDKFLPIEMVQYKIGRDEIGRINLLKSWEWKKEKEVMNYG